MSKLLTREEFEALRLQSAEAMSADVELRRKVFDLIVSADRYYWLHQTSWFGEPVLQLAQDMFALQEIVFKTRPKFIIELGVAWGGSLLFYSTLMEGLGGGHVVGVDTYIPEHVKQKLDSFGKISDRIALIKGSSTDETTFSLVKSLVGDTREVLVILDSFHTHDHVLKELRLYSQLIGVGHYLVCCDTHVEHIPEIVENRPRPWGLGNNPKTARDAFLKENGRFEVDQVLENKLLMTLHPGGYLRCCKE